MVSSNISADITEWDRLWSMGIVSFLIVSAVFLTGVAVVPLVALLAVIGVGPTSTVGYTVQVVAQQFVFGVVTVVYTIYSETDLLARLPSLRDVGWIVVGVLLLLGLSQTLSFLLEQSGASDGINQIEQFAREQPQLLLYLIPVAVILIGPGEELLFRGGVQGRLSQSFGVVPAIVLASALFGLVHIPAVVASSAVSVGGYVVTAFVLGLVLGGLYEHTNNLVVPALAHGVYNALLFVALYLLITG